MSKPEIHAQSSQRRFKGKADDYKPIHDMMDSSKSSIADSRHRVCFHHSFGIFVMEKMFGINFERLEKLAEKYNWTKEEVVDIINWKEDCTFTGTSIKNSDGDLVQVRDIAEGHVQEDFGGKFIPTIQDYLENVPLLGWMNNGNGNGSWPESFRKIAEGRKEKTKTFYLT